MNLKAYASSAAFLLCSWAGHAQTFTQINLGTPTLVSGTSKQVGSVYKYANAGGSGTNKIDAYITIVKTSNTGSDDVGVFAVDQPASVNGGYDASFQPVTSCSNVNSSGLWTKGQCGWGSVEMTYSQYQNYLVHFRLYFKKAGTQTDTALNIKAAFVDIDGFGGSNSDEREQDAFMPPSSYALSNGSSITISNRSDGLVNAEGCTCNVGGIGFTNGTTISQVTYLNRTFIDFGIGMNTHTAYNRNNCYGASDGGRLASVSFCTQPSNCTQTTDLTVTLSGKVYDDADGSGTSTFTNIKTNSEPGTNGGGLYVYALDSATGTVIGKDAVGTSGSWSINDIPKNLGVVLLLSKVNVAVGVTNGAPSTGELNTGWVGTSPLVRPSFRPTSNTSGLHFGIEQIPSGAPYTAATQLNPGGNIQVSIPSAAFTGSDSEDGPYTAGLSGKTVTLSPGTNGTLYYNGTAVTSTQSFSGFDASKVGIDPSGTTPTLITSTFSYSVNDAAGKPSNPATISMPFEPPVPISGYVWADGNGDAIKGSGESYTNAGGINVVLTDASGTVLQVVPVNASTGVYTLDQSRSNGNYKVILTTANPSISSTLTTSTLPAGSYGNWLHTGVNLNGTANTSNTTGVVSVSTLTTAITNQNFGIEQPPTGFDVTVPDQQNPGDTVKVNVPSSAFTGTDPEDGNYTAGLTGRKVDLIPGTNGNLYYNGSPVTTTTTITSFNPALVQIDPTGPTPTGYDSVITTVGYKLYDNAGVPSTAKTITMKFTAILCIKVRAYLEGSLINNGSATASDGRPLMRDNLRNSPFNGKNYIPTADPYETATTYVNVTSQYTKLAPQTTHSEFHQVTDSATVFSVTGQNAIVDWVFVELRSKGNNATVQATRAGLIQRDGDIVDVDGQSCLAFPGVAIDSYYVAVRHRSHLGTMTKYGQSAANLETLVDFTVPGTPIYDKGNFGPFNFAGLGEKDNVVGTYRAMWAGDFSADGKVKYDAPNDDLNNLLFDVLLYPTNTSFATNYDFAYGYMQSDFDMNAKVKYDAPNDDNNYLLFQALLYPLNTTFATNFDFVIQQLP